MINQIGEIVREDQHTLTLIVLYCGIICVGLLDFLEQTEDAFHVLNQSLWTVSVHGCLGMAWSLVEHVSHVL